MEGPRWRIRERREGVQWVLRWGSVFHWREAMKMRSGLCGLGLVVWRLDDDDDDDVEGLEEEGGWSRLMRWLGGSCRMV